MLDLIYTYSINGNISLLECHSTLKSLKEFMYMYGCDMNLYLDEGNFSKYIHRFNYSSEYHSPSSMQALFQSRVISIFTRP